MKILLEDRSKSPVAKTTLVTIKQAAVAALKFGFDVKTLHKLNYVLSLSLVDDDEIQTLNKKYRESDKPTDVLSFPAVENDFGKTRYCDNSDMPQSSITGFTRYPSFCMGDIVISTETALRQAQEYGHTLERELAFLTIHGVLHLFGLDHETSLSDETQMIEIQKQLIASLWLPTPIE